MNKNQIRNKNYSYDLQLSKYFFNFLLNYFFLLVNERMRHTSTSDYDPFYTIDFIKRGPRVREGSYGTGASAQRQYDPFVEDPAM